MAFRLRAPPHLGLHPVRQYANILSYYKLSLADSHVNVASNKSLSEFVNFVEKGLNIKQRSDWYRISQHQLEEMGALYVVRKSGGLYRLLCRVYPEHRWSRERLSHRTKKAEQHALTEHLSDLKLAE
mgnify:CR=1 FL=1